MNRRNKSKEYNASRVLQAGLVPIARFMIRGGFGAHELLEAAKSASIEAAIDEVIPGGSKVNISRLAVATGLTRKEISARMGHPKRQAAASSKRSTEHRVLRVLRGWRMDPMFQRADGRPADLPLRDAPWTFSELVRRYGADVTPVSVLRELERMQAISMTRSGKVRFRTQAAKSQTNASEQMEEFAALLKDFANTVQQSYSPSETPLFFEFKDASLPSPAQAALFQRTFSTRAATLLGALDQWLAQQLKQKPAPKNDPAFKSRVGLGVYLVREDFGDDSPAGQHLRPLQKVKTPLANRKYPNAST